MKTVISEERLKKEKHIKTDIDYKGIISVEWFYYPDCEDYAVDIYINQNIYHEGEVYDTLKEVYEQDLRPILDELCNELLNYKNKIIVDY